MTTHHIRIIGAFEKLPKLKFHAEIPCRRREVCDCGRNDTFAEYLRNDIVETHHALRLKCRISRKEFVATVTPQRNGDMFFGELRKKTGRDDRCIGHRFVEQRKYLGYHLE